MENRQHWGTKLGFLLAAVGSAVGLGNFWKFPYVTGEGGGALFLLIYVLCVVLVGIPVLCAELLIGRRNQLNAVDSLRKEFPKTPYEIAGWFGLTAALGILGFYVLIAGWCLYYTVAAVMGNLSFGTELESQKYFESFITNQTLPIYPLVVFMLINVGILLGGVKNGIEKASKILMPVLFLILLVLIVRSLTLGDGVSEGLRFLFKPDFSQVSFTVVIGALGLAFFKLSLGMGTMITYGSYLKPEDNILKSSVQIAFFDTLIAVLAGIAIFPAVFALGYEPNAGVGLVFFIIPALLSTLPLGVVFGSLFFFALTVAALTSSISIFEVIVAFFTERFKLSRKTVLLSSFVLITLLATVVSLSITYVFPFVNLNLFDILDKLTEKFLLPLGGLIIAIAVGWSLSKTEFLKELGDNTVSRVLHVFIKFVAPLIIFIVFIYGVLGLF